MNKNSQIKLGALLIGVVLFSLLVVALDFEINESINFDKTVADNQNKFNYETRAFFKSVINRNVEKDFIIKYKDGFDKSKLDKFSDIISVDDFKVSQFKAEINDLESIIGDDFVEYVELDQELDLLGEVVPFNVEQVNAESAWNFSQGVGVKVAILDTGISVHSDLTIAGGWNVVDNNANFSDVNGHGTAVGGVVSALLNDDGLVGVSPNASLYAVKIMEGSSGSLSDAISGVEWAVDNDMNIVSMSFGFDGYSKIFREVLEQAYDEGILLVGAAGNDDSDVVYPAAYTKVIGVGAVDEDNDRADFSNYGFELELVAPGVDINSTALNNDYGVGSGTSLAVPHVAGVAALIWSFNTSLTNEQVRGKLRNDAIDLGISGKDDYYGYGLVWFNLTSTDYSYYEDVYYYEVYNITDYGLENESYVFWLSGNGTIDDVDFSEGYYLINKTINGAVISQKIFVDENGTIFILISFGVLDDWYANGGSSSDAKIWEDSYYIKMKVTTSIHDYECWNYDDVGSGTIDECYFRDSTVYNNCEENHCVPGVSCYIGSGYIGGYHYVVNGVSKIKEDALVMIYNDECTFLDSKDKTYYVFDQKKNVCSGSNYYLHGRYGLGGGDWKLYSQSYPCGSGRSCDSTQDEQTCSTEDCNPQSPCRRLVGYSCDETDESVTNDCYTGLNCTSNVCTDPNATNTTDLLIEKAVPIQVINTTDLVNQKTTLIRVFVLNNGSTDVTARANLTLTTDLVDTFTIMYSSHKMINSNETEYFDFYFIPTKTITNGNISIGVEIYEN